MSLGSDLRRILSGPVLEPGDDGFERACRPWNLAIEQPVRAIVEAADAADVGALVGYARRRGLAITVQPSGHGATGNAADTILLRTARAGEVNVRPAERMARVGAGVPWAKVQAVASRYGLTGLAGSSPAVSVTGYTLGGGLGWFGRVYGLAANSVRAFDIVDAEATRVRVTADTEPDLFWALRGGGGDFAIVTAVEFDLYPAGSLYGGRMLWPAEQAAPVLDAYRELTATAPDQITAWYRLLRSPGSEPRVAVDAAFLGDTAEGEALLRRLDQIEGRFCDSRRKLAVADLGGITEEPTEPAPAMWRTELLTTLNDEGAARLLDRPIDPLTTVQIRHLGGALARPSNSAAGHIDEPYALYLMGLPANDVRNRLDSFGRAFAPYTIGRKPFTLLAPGERAACAFPASTLARLQAIKRAHDPHGVFRSNYPVSGR
jgi:FAD/FMN-containing dehydrogenase